MCFVGLAEQKVRGLRSFHFLSFFIGMVISSCMWQLKFWSKKVVAAAPTIMTIKSVKDAQYF